MSARLSYTLKQAAEVTGLSQDVLKRAIHSSDPKRKLRAKAISTNADTGKASKFVVLHADLAAWLDSLDAA
jgi:hypothetical protein